MRAVEDDKVPKCLLRGWCVFRMMLSQWNQRFTIFHSVEKRFKLKFF